MTYGENIGTPGCPIPPLPRLQAHTRQAILLDRWPTDAPTRPHWTTVANWKQTGKDLVFNGETYYWSKHHEFQKFLDLPQRVSPPIELAFNLAATPLFNLLGPTLTEFLFGLLILALGIGGHFYFGRIESRPQKIPV